MIFSGILYLILALAFICFTGSFDGGLQNINAELGDTRVFDIDNAGKQTGRAPADNQVPGPNFSQWQRDKQVLDRKAFCQGTRDTVCLYRDRRIIKPQL